jgi:hypothetical protein
VKKIICLVTLFLFIFRPSIYAQEQSVDSLINEFLDSDEDFMDQLISSRKFQFFYSRVNYDTKTLFAGRDIGFQKFNATGQLAYFHPSGISVATAAVYYRDLVPKIGTALIMAGYNGVFTKSPDYRYRISYNRYFFPGGDSITKGSIHSSVGIGFTVDKKNAGFRLDYALLVGSKKYSQVLGSVYGDFLLLRIGKSIPIKFEPEASFYAGNDQAIIINWEAIPDMVSVPSTLIEPEKEKFGWMNTELQFPITSYYKNFDFKFGFNINFPRAVANPNETYKPTTYFNFSIGYLLDLN